MIREVLEPSPSGTAPLVSVILCTYDRAALLERAIRSVLAQTFADFELLVIDDGSRDGTSALALAFAADDPRVVYERHVHRGLAGARNVGLALARGEWVTFLDSDDAYTPDHLATRVALVEARPVDALFGGVRLVGDRRLRYVADVERPGRRIHLSRCHIGGSLFVRRSVLAALGGFHELPFAEDHELMTRIERRYRVARCSRATYIYNLAGDDRLGRRQRVAADGAARLIHRGSSPRRQRVFLSPIRGSPLRTNQRGG